MTRKEYYAANKERVLASNRRYQSRNMETLKAYRRAYHQANRESIVEKVGKWQKENVFRSNETKRRWAKANRAKVLLARKKWNDQHRRPYIAKWMRDRRRNDPSFKILSNLRNRISLALKGICKSRRTVELLGCSIESFWLYLESRFEDGMTRENYGSVWHVDHIVPVAIFDLSKPDHQSRCFHFSNLQPLFVRDNLKKRHKTDGQLRMI